MYVEKLSQLVTLTTKQKHPQVRKNLLYNLPQSTSIWGIGCRTPLRACGLASTLYGALLTTMLCWFQCHLCLEIHGDTVPGTSKKMEGRGSAIYFEITWLYLYRGSGLTPSSPWILQKGHAEATSIQISNEYPDLKNIICSPSLKPDPRTHGGSGIKPIYGFVLLQLWVQYQLDCRISDYYCCSLNSGLECVRV